jgi:hypothetical protein
MDREGSAVAVKTVWFATLMALICLEGLGRKYLPSIPGVAFYFAKDVALLFGYVQLRPPAYVGRLWKTLYGGFGIAWLVGFAWTVIEMLNPEHDSPELALIGIRAYWLWWLAPALIAGVLQDPKEKRRAIYVLSALALVISAFAMLQFVSPASADINAYANSAEGMRLDTAVVFSTGRARVASTFSYLTGFSDFTILVPPLLLSLGLGTSESNVRRAALFGTLAVAAVIPMSGSRAALVAAVLVLVIIAWSSGLFLTVAGRRVLIGAAVGTLLGMTIFPEALQGVQDRFTESNTETQSRFLEALEVLPPVTMAVTDYPALGFGTGMQQNARWSLRLPEIPFAEGENQRYLLELGAVGFSLIWLSKLGLVMLLLRSRRLLLRAGKREAAGAALAYAAVTYFGFLTFDHVWQALYFTGVGFIFAEVLSVVKAQQERAAEATRAEPAIAS